MVKRSPEIYEVPSELQSFGLARQSHEKVHHNKVVATLSQLKSRFWIIKGRQLVKIICKCRVCRRYEKRGYKVPPKNDLRQKPIFNRLE